MGRALQNHSVKYLSAATLLVFIWFVWSLGLRNEAQERLAGIVPSVGTDASHKEPPKASPEQPSHEASNEAPKTKPSGAPHPDILDEAAAKQYCNNYRLHPFPRDRVASRKIYDLLLINTELEILDIRMGQMAPGVDYFVILESDTTFTDKPKPLHVEENWARFQQHHSQMIRRTMDLTTGDFKKTWEREFASRNAMYSQVIPFLTGQEEAHTDDVLLVSDVDEMFKPETLKVFRNCIIPDKVTTQSDLFYYSFQWVNEYDWMHPQATIYKGKDTVLPQVLRTHGNEHMILHDAAWHCSYCFPTVAEIVKKITSFSHTEMDRPEFKDPVKIVERVRNGRDMFERSNCTRVEHNKDVPEFVANNREKYGYMLDRDPPNANFIDYTP
ncbi:hypothetical protein RB594_000830 [Gaeumannomyces avenae]